MVARAISEKSPLIIYPLFAEFLDNGIVGVVCKAILDFRIAAFHRPPKGLFKYAAVSGRNLIERLGVLRFDRLMETIVT